MWRWKARPSGQLESKSGNPWIRLRRVRAQHFSHQFKQFLGRGWILGVIQIMGVSENVGCLPKSMIFHNNRIFRRAYGCPLAGLRFWAFLAARCGHKMPFWWMEHKWKCYMTTSWRSTLKKAGLCPLLITLLSLSISYCLNLKCDAWNSNCVLESKN